MLQQKEISRLLSQAVAGGSGVYAVSLLSASGLPLITVAPPEASCAQDSLRMYSLLAVSLHKQQNKTGADNVDNWELLVLERDLKAQIQSFATQNGDGMFVSLFYCAAYPDSSAKARLDSVANALATGLAGYKASAK